MKSITKITENIYRLVIPFMDVYTTIFVIKTPKGAALFDTATYSEDVEQYIIPALEKLEMNAKMLKYVVISHNHRDHPGTFFRLHWPDRDRDRNLAFRGLPANVRSFWLRKMGC